MTRSPDTENRMARDRTRGEALDRLRRLDAAWTPTAEERAALRRAFAVVTDDQRRRVAKALAETRTALERATRYSPDLRDHALIASYEAHITKLIGMLAE